MSTDENSKLTDFQDTTKKQDTDSNCLETTNSKKEKIDSTISQNTNRQSFDQIESDIFESPPSEYPTEKITEQSTQTITFGLCTTKSESENVEFDVIGGKGGFGGNTTIEKRDEVYNILSELVGLPVVRSGGGTLSIEEQYTFGRLTNIEKTNSSLKVEINELYNTSNRSPKDDPRRCVLGSWKISVPKTIRDYVTATKAIVKYTTGNIDFLLPNKRNTHRTVKKSIERFESLSIADKIKIPPYKTRLGVISNQFETHATKTTGQSLRNKNYQVKSIVVSNPNGGYYQLGLKVPSRTPFTETPTCYISHSYNSPPKPNTAFTIKTRFSLNELSHTQIPNPPNPTVVKPDKKVLNSPLPEPRLQTEPNSIENIGEKTSRKLRPISDEYLSFEKIAYELYSNGEDLTQNQKEEIKDILSSLPHGKEIINKLKSEAKSFE